MVNATGGSTARAIRFAALPRFFRESVIRPDAARRRGIPARTGTQSIPTLHLATRRSPGRSGLSPFQRCRIVATPDRPTPLSGLRHERPPQRMNIAQLATDVRAGSFARLETSPAPDSPLPARQESVASLPCSPGCRANIAAQNVEARCRKTLSRRRRQFRPAAGVAECATWRRAGPSRSGTVCPDQNVQCKP